MDLDSKLQEIAVLLARIDTDLRHHIKRTEMLEEEVKFWRKDLKPIQAHIAFVSIFSKLLLIVAAMGGAIAAFLALK
jgi:uncharacterized protein (UPF0335 family)